MIIEVTLDGVKGGGSRDSQGEADCAPCIIQIRVNTGTNFKGKRGGSD